MTAARNAARSTRRMLRWWLAAALLAAAGPLAAGGWPRMAAWEATVAVPDADHPAVRLDIPDAAGRTAYVLSCGNFDSEDPDFDYSGDFECRLMSALPDARYSTLLTDNPAQTRDWESRGRFFVEDLVGACARYPDFGAQRGFRLRDMELQLDVQQVRTRQVAGKTRLAALVLHVRVAPASVPSPIALPSAYLEPPLSEPDVSMQRDCAVVRAAAAR